MPRSAWFLAFAVIMAGCLEPLLPTQPDEPRPTPSDLAEGAFVVASNPIAAAVGMRVLEEGGNAIDAAVATAFALNVAEPSLSGIGGGAFINIWTPDGVSTIIDARETAPAASTADQFLRPDGTPEPFITAHTQGYAVGVPGAVAGWWEAHERFGTMNWSALLAPAATLAADGVEVSEYLSYHTAVRYAKLVTWRASAEAFLKGAQCMPDPEGPCVGAPYAPGEILVQPDLARTLDLIAAGGIDAFYGQSSSIPQAIVDAVAVRSGRMTTDDVHNYTTVEREPLRFTYGDMEFLTMPPPGSGVAVGQILKILEPMGISAMGDRSADALHLLAEASHLAYADRGAYVADPAFVDVPTDGLLDEAYLAERRSLIDPERTNPSIGPGNPPGSTGPPDDWTFDDTGSHTTHFIVVDDDGLVVSATATIEAVFGTGMVVPGFGFLLNNEMTDFDLTPGGVNEVEPGKRPRSSMSPTIALRHGVPAFALGAAGGPTIVTTVSLVSQSVIEHGTPLAAAVDLPRIYSPSYARGVQFEGEVPPDVVADLRAKGHDTRPTRPFIGRLQAAAVYDGVWEAVADDRLAEGGVPGVG